MSIELSPYAEDILKVIDIVGDILTDLKYMKGIGIVIPQEKPFYKSLECDCGCGRDFELYYDSKDLAVVVPGLKRTLKSENKNTGPVRRKMKSRITKVLPNLRELNICFDEDEVPLYLSAFREKRGY